MPSKPPRVRMLKPLLKAAEFRTVAPQARTYANRLADDPGLAFYSTAAWRDLRAAVLRERGSRCEMCGKESGRMYVDHIVELRDGGAPLDRSNLQVLDSSCHQRKTGQTRAHRLGIA